MSVYLAVQQHGKRSGAVEGRIPTMTTAPALMTGPVAEPAHARWTARLGRAWAEYLAYRATLAELSALTEAQLRDVGMRREALPAMAREAARKI
jgi:uncharacterized protein YjiS (DUF1127 family)